MPNDDELIDQPDVNSKTHTYGTDAFQPVNGVKSRRDTNQTANTFKIAKARSQNQISASGPGNWSTPEDLWYLQMCYGQHVSFRSISLMAWASLVRVAVWEPLSGPTRSLVERAANLERLLTNTDYIGRRVVWDDWYRRSHLRVLVQARSAMEQRGVLVQELLSEFSRGVTRPWPERVRRLVKWGFQKAVV